MENEVRIVDKEPLGKLTWSEHTAEVLREKGVDEGTIGLEDDVVVTSDGLELINKLLPWGL